jgi:hypothetical protein
MPLYLASRGEWLDLTCGIPGVWILTPKLQFPYECLQDNIGENIHDLACGDTAPKVQPTKERSSKLDFTTFLKFCSSKSLSRE